MTNRRGQVLPLAMVGVVLVSLGLYAHHFVASSEYHQVHQIANAYQTSLVTDAANTELNQQQARAAAGTGQGSPWAEEVLSDLERSRVVGKKDGAPDGTEKTWGREHKFQLKAELPVAQRVAREGGLPNNLSVDLTVGPFKLAPNTIKAKDFYAEPVFADADKDIVAWNFRGPMTTEVRAGSQVERKTTTLAITDATPPASDFAIFSYEPPIGADEAQVEYRTVNDLNKGGRFTVYPRQQGRVMVRGPFYLVPEEGTDEKSPYLGGLEPQESVSYQERKWANWSTIPGNRALIQPPFNAGTVLNTIVSWIHKIAPGIGSEAYGSVIRPEASGSPQWNLGPIPVWAILGPAGMVLKLAGVDLELGPWHPEVSLVLGLAISGEPTVSPGDWTTVLPKDQPGMFASAAYFHGLLKPGDQTFSLFGNTAQRGTGPDAETGEDIYRGIVYNSLEEGSQPKAYDGGLRPAPGQDFDAILPEPLPREEGKLADVGILGYYGVATFESHSIVDMGIFEMLSTIMGPHIKLLHKLIELTGISPDLHVVLRQWHVYGNKIDKEHPLTLEGVIEAFTNAFPQENEPDKSYDEKKKALKNSAVLAPYGLYFCEHSVRSSERVLKALKALVVLHASNVLVGMITGAAVGKIAKAIFKKTKTPVRKATDDPPDFDLEPGARLQLAKIGWQAKQVLHGAYHRLYHTVFARHVAKELGNDFTKSLTRNVVEAILRIPVLNYVKVYSHHSFVGSTGFLPDLAKIFAGAYGYEDFKHPFSNDPRAAFTQLTGLREHTPDYPNGFYPPKYTSWGATFTRSYPTLEAYLKNEAVDGVLPLRGTVMIKSLKYKGEPIRYRGSGIIVTVTDDENKGALLDARVEPAEDAPGNWLTLVHLVTDKVRAAPKMPSLELGELFTGTVFSQTGVKPAKEGAAILGNLVCGNINKSAIDESLKGPEQGVHVRYAVERLKDLNKADRRPMWSLEVTAHPEAPPPVAGAN